MKLTVKTLQGVAFSLEVESSETVVQVKEKIQSQQQFPVEQQKLIHAGKVLRDDSPLSEYNIKENDFLVVMVTKPKAPRAAPTPAATPAQAATTATATSSSSAPAPTTTPAAATPAPTPATSVAPSTSAASSTATATPPTVTSASSAPASSTAASGSGIVVGEQANAMVQQLCEMGFPEDQVRAALQAAFNNPDRAVEYLMNGIPDHARAPPAAATASAAPSGGQAGAAPTGASASVGASLEALRNHPQFDALRQLIQSNPSALPAVLQQIGSQSPELLRLIHENQDQFVRMLNEPITSTPGASAGAGAAGAGAAGAIGGLDLGGAAAGGMPTAQQIQQVVESLTPEQQAQMAAQMGMTPDQLRGLSQMIGNLPPGAVEQMMASMGGAGGAGGGPDSHRIALTEEEMAAVNRLCDLGFDRGDAVQAYLACDKNEALAANLLMDSMADSFGAGGSGGGGGAGGDDHDDIYE